MERRQLSYGMGSLPSSRVPRAGIIKTQRGEARRGELIGEDAPRLMRAERLVTHGGAHDDATIAVGVMKPSKILADRDGRRHCQNQNPCCWDRELARPRSGRETFRRASASWRRMKPVPKRRTWAAFVSRRKKRAASHQARRRWSAVRNVARKSLFGVRSPFGCYEMTQRRWRRKWLARRKNALSLVCEFCHFTSTRRYGSRWRTKK